MKQIRTVIYPIENVHEFDNELNELIENGWELTKRELTHTQGLPSEAFNIPLFKVLYAELQRG